MATSSFGHMEPFNLESESITACLEPMNLFLAANGIPEGRTVAVFLSNIGGVTYGLLRSPDKPQTKTLPSLSYSKDILSLNLCSLLSTFIFISGANRQWRQLPSLLLLWKIKTGAVVSTISQETRKKLFPEASFETICSSPQDLYGRTNAGSGSNGGSGPL